MKIFAKYSLSVFGWHVLVYRNLYSLNLKHSNISGWIIVLITLFGTLGITLLIGIIETHFWKHINKKLSPMYQIIKNKFTYLTNKNKTV
ncbi:MAG: hypothetical protein ACRCTJ_07600 [Brevinema sp.]